MYVNDNYNDKVGGAKYTMLASTQCMTVGTII